MEGKIYVTPPPPQLSVSNRQIIDTNNPSKRIYQVWKGSNRFFLGGRLIFGPDARSLVFTVILILTPVIVFNVFISQRLFKEFQYHLGLLIVVISVVFPICIIILLILTSSRDPGILPCNPHPPEPEDDDDDASGVPMDWAGNNTSAPSLPSTKDVFVNGIVVKVKYCHTCMLYRPPRCSHCSICNNCVERFDHHCPWVGQCIGKRNYRFFFMFISSTTLLCLYVLAFCWVHIRKIMEAYHYNLWKALLKSPISGILILYTFVAAWFVGGLTSFHLYLICTNQTTYENFRFRYDGKKNPYNIGCARNVGEIFFSKVPNSKNNFRAKLKENSLSTFTNSLSVGHVLSPELPKTSIDIEMGGKRQAVVEEELEEIHSRIESVAELERCGTQPRHTNRGHKDNWEITPHIHASTAEFGKEHGLTDREKIYVSH